MTATILLIGPHSRELEVLKKRLERERLTVEVHPATPRVVGWLVRNPVQAVLFWESVPPSLVERVIWRAQSLKQIGNIPCIGVAHDALPAGFSNVKGIGETFRLHHVTLTEMVQRLKFAIQLCQLAR